MSEKKMIIRNCPAFSFAGGCLNGKVKVWDCQDCTDCILKQIVNVLKENTCNPEECGMNKPDWNGEVYGCNAGFNDNISGCSCALANNLLRKLDIQEVER